MRTNIELDDDLVEQLLRLNPNLKSKKDAVNFALWSTVQHLRESNWAELARSRPIDPDYDYKATRGGV